MAGRQKKNRKSPQLQFCGSYIRLPVAGVETTSATECLLICLQFILLMAVHIAATELIWAALSNSLRLS